MNKVEDLIERYVDNRISAEEYNELLELIKTGQIEEAVKAKISQMMSDGLKKGELPDFELRTKGEKIFHLIRTKNAAFTNGAIHSRGLNEPSKKAKSIYLVLLPYAAVFVVLIIVGLFAGTRTTPANDARIRTNSVVEEVTVIRSGSTAQNVTLQDGTVVVLEPGGELRYNKNFLNAREVYLSGDAFFEVTKDTSRPFFVYTNEVTTKVLGTSFRIKANRGEKEIVVAVKTGKVSVIAKSGSKDVQNKKIQEITLTPNQQAIYRRREQVVVKKIVEEPQVINGNVTLKDSYVNEPVVFILQALTESYGVHIRFDKESLAGCTLTSDIIEGEGLFEQLEIVCNALGGTYKVENDASIVIEASGCER